MNRHDGFSVTGAQVIRDLSLLDDMLQTLSVDRTRYAEIDITRETNSGELRAFLCEPAEYLAWNARAKRFGVRYRHVITPEVARHPAMRELVPSTAGFIEWRVASRVTTRVHVQDGRALTALDPNASGVGALLVRGAGAAAWRQIAETIWADARPWSGAAADRDSARACAVVDLLLEGFDDAAVARRLDVSVRTVRRDVADLMVEHRAKSRLQLGAALGALR